MVEAEDGRQGNCAEEQKCAQHDKPGHAFRRDWALVLEFRFFAGCFNDILSLLHYIHQGATLINYLESCHSIIALCLLIQRAE